MSEVHLPPPQTFADAFDEGALDEASLNESTVAGPAPEEMSIVAQPAPKGFGETFRTAGLAARRVSL